MRAPTIDRTYHVLHFDGTSEAAAFVAALSRYLDSPSGRACLEEPNAVEVWSHSMTKRPSVEVYLSDGALAAASAVFAPVPVSGTRAGHNLPKDCSLLIGDASSPVWGITDAERHLEGGRGGS